MKSVFIVAILCGLHIGYGAELKIGSSGNLYKDQTFVWTVSTEKIDKSPEWKDGEEPPLCLVEAEKLAKDWVDKQAHTGPPIPKRPAAILISHFPEWYDGKYFYKFYYSQNTSSMQQWDSGHTQSQGWFLRDGDIFDKRVASSNNDLLNAASGYDRVFYISHGDVDSSGNYTMMAPDGTFNSTSFFSGLLGGTNVILGTCFNGFSSGGNTSSLNGALTTITWGTALSQSLQQAKDYLWE